MATPVRRRPGFPEIDRVEWFDLEEARRRLKAAQVPFVDRPESAPNTSRNRSSVQGVESVFATSDDGLS